MQQGLAAQEVLGLPPLLQLGEWAQPQLELAAVIVLLAPVEATVFRVQVVEVALELG